MGNFKFAQNRAQNWKIPVPNSQKSSGIWSVFPPHERQNLARGTIPAHGAHQRTLNAQRTEKRTEKRPNAPKKQPTHGKKNPAQTRKSDARNEKTDARNEFSTKKTEFPAQNWTKIKQNPENPRRKKQRSIGFGREYLPLKNLNSNNFC